MTIPLVAFLFFYLLFVFIWLIFSLVALYHMIKYGQLNFTAFSTTFIYIGVSIILLFISYQYLSQIDWKVGLTIFQGGSSLFGSTNFY
jgi:ABC-type maltose transport system permease subunit